MLEKVFERLDELGITLSAGERKFVSSSRCSFGLYFWEREGIFHRAVGRAVVPNL